MGSPPKEKTQPQTQLFEQSPLFKTNHNKDGGLTLAAVIAALGGLAKLMNEISGNASDLEKLIRTMSNNIQEIRNTVIRIEKFIDRLPLLIDKTLEDKFSQYVDNRLRALIQMYLEVKASLIESKEVPAEIINRLVFIHNEISTESRVIMGYGVSAASAIALTTGVEDDCAELLRYSPSFRKEALKSLASFFSRMLIGSEEQISPDSIEGYLNSLEDLTTQVDNYISKLDQKFVTSTRSWSSPWTCTTSGTKNEKTITCRRVNYVAAVIGNSTEGYSYQETSVSESRSEIIGSASRFHNLVEDAAEYESKDDFFITNPELFREDLSAFRSDVEYANSIVRFRDELTETKENITSLKNIYSDALSNTNIRLSRLI